jgi:ribonucleoside-diphosphate reductase alpha chain
VTYKNTYFRTHIAETTFNNKYRHAGCESWPLLAKTVVEDVCIVPDGPEIPKSRRDQLIQYITDMKFIPGGRYLYYAGRGVKYFNNCYLLRSQEDTREDWANLSWKAESCLTTGGGIGNDYSVYRGKGAPLARTGGVATGPIAKMEMLNEIGRRVMQGGSRRSAIYASLNHAHPDIHDFLVAKNWSSITVPGTELTLADLKLRDFNWPAPLDCTNISINYDNAWLLPYFQDNNNLGNVFLKNVYQSLSTGEPGFSFNFFDHETESLRNACTEVTSSDDSDVCNLGSVNLSRIDSIAELASVCELAIDFLLFGTLRAELPYDKVYRTREKNRRLGLGLMGVHEWLLRRGYRYEVVPELHQWLSVYRGVSDHVAQSTSKSLSISCPIATRAIAPTGTIGIIAGTTTGIEPVFSVATKRRYLSNGTKWHYQYTIDYTADILIRSGINPEKIETATDLALDVERRIKFQADVQDYVDMGISSTINLPAWGTKYNNPDRVRPVGELLAKYASRLRGCTFYPDGSRGGQPLVAVPFEEAKERLGNEYTENIETREACVGGICGL